MVEPLQTVQFVLAGILRTFNKQIHWHNHNSAPQNTTLLYKVAEEETSRLISPKEIPSSKTLMTKRHRGGTRIANHRNHKTSRPKLER